MYETPTLLQPSISRQCTLDIHLNIAGALKYYIKHAEEIIAQHIFPHYHGLLSLRPLLTKQEAV